MLESMLGVGVRVELLIFDWGVYFDAAVASLMVMEDLEVFEDGVGEFDPVLPSLPVQKFDLHPAQTIR